MPVMHAGGAGPPHASSHTEPPPSGMGPNFLPTGPMKTGGGHQSVALLTRDGSLLLVCSHNKVHVHSAVSGERLQTLALPDHGVVVDAALHPDHAHQVFGDLSSARPARVHVLDPLSCARAPRVNRLTAVCSSTP